MDSLHAVEKLAKVARRERPPTTNVSAQVLMHIRLAERPATRPLVWLAAASLAAAAVALFLAVTVSTAPDPVRAFFDPLEAVIL